MIDYILDPLLESKANRFTLLTWAICSQLGKISGNESYADYSIAWLDDWQLTKPLAEVLRSVTSSEEEVQNQLLLLRLGISQQDWYDRARKTPLAEIFNAWFTDPEIQSFLRVNRYKEVLWYNRETFEQFAWWMLITPITKMLADPTADR